MPRAPGAELLIALAGPAVNLAIAAVLAILPWGGRFTTYLIDANLVLALFNLIPAFPMDGGRVLRALLSVPFGRLRATEVAATLGQALAIALPVVELGFGHVLLLHLVLAAFLYLAAGNELQQARYEERDRHDDDRGDHHVEAWRTPPGYRWVNQGRGAWQLVPIVVTSSPGHSSWRR